MFREIRERWMRFWFEPSEPTDLGVSRLLFFSILFLFYLPQDFSGWATVSSAFWAPTTFFKLLHVPVLSEFALMALQIIWKLALLLVAIGLWTRVSLMTSAALGFYLLGLPHNFGKTHHFDALIVLVMAGLAFSRCGDAWSVDALIRAARRSGPVADRPAPSGEYTWPIRLVWCLMSIVFFSSGFSKLRTSGLSWINAENLAIILQQANYHTSNADPWFGALSLRMAGWAWACWLLAASTYVFELGYPLALCFVPARWIVVPGMFMTQLGIRAFMGPTFQQFWFCNMFWIPWRRAGAWLEARLPKRAAMTIIFDGSCGLCQATVSVVRQLDLLHRIDIRNALTEWPELQRRFPHLTQDACLQDMHGVTADGRTVVGFDTYRTMAWPLPLGWLLLPMLYAPGVRPIGQRVYRWVANRRFHSGCPVPSVNKP